MDSLKEKIRTEGRVISGGILKVDSFLNHEIDPFLMKDVAKEFAKRFRQDKITKVLTVEASGIAVGIMTAYELGVPMIFAKKKKPSTMDGTFITKKVFSFTKNTEYDIIISSEYIEKEDNVLIVDDFLALGNAALALGEIVKDAGAKVAGIGIVIEKGFQNGGKLLRESGYRVESLATIKSLDSGVVEFL